MGYWTTLHLFDDKIFREKTLPEFTGQTGDFKRTYLEFIRSHRLGGIAKLSEQEIQDIIDNAINTIQVQAKKFDKEFRKHLEFERSEDQRNYLNENDWTYDFSRFFEYLVFNTCADFYPYLPCGKYGLASKLDLRRNSFADELINTLDRGISTSLFSADSMGIISWITSEEAALLFYDKEAIVSDNEEFLSAFLNLLQFAYDNKLGLLFGVDMESHVHKTLPGFRLIAREKWETMQVDKLLFG
jgi:hypothetical protein